MKSVFKPNTHCKNKVIILECQETNPFLVEPLGPQLNARACVLKRSGAQPRLHAGVFAFVRLRAEAFAKDPERLRVDRRYSTQACWVTSIV